jgi:hypothetical protein
MMVIWPPFLRPIRPEPSTTSSHVRSSLSRAHCRASRPYLLQVPSPILSLQWSGVFSGALTEERLNPRA